MPNRYYYDEVVLLFLFLIFNLILRYFLAALYPNDLEVFSPLDDDVHTYDDLGMSDGARCGPRSYCINHRCVPVPELSDYCKQCLGINKGCDQHGRCICDREDDCVAGGRATPPPGAKKSPYFLSSPPELEWIRNKRFSIRFSHNLLLLSL